MGKKITPLVRIPWAKPLLTGKEKKYVNQALDSTWISGGFFVERLEQEFLHRIKMPYGISTSSGTTALYLALLGLNIGPYDQVIVPGFCFAAAVNMVKSVGARPVYADIDPLTWCLEPSDVSRKVTAKTKAIMAVHPYGNLCDMDRLKEIAAKNKIFLVEDAAESLFSQYRNKFAGSLGDVGCFSFQATKTLTTGEGGFICWKDKAFCERMKILRNHGMVSRKHYWHEVVGHNFRLTNLQAAVGCAQLEAVGDVIRLRQKGFKLYLKHLSKIPGVVLQKITDGVTPVMWTVAVKIDPRAFGMGRDRLIKRLMDEGIETRPGFYSFDLMPPYQAPRLRHCHEVSQHVLCLPFFAGISEKQIIAVTSLLRKLAKR